MKYSTTVQTTQSSTSNANYTLKSCDAMKNCKVNKHSFRQLIKISKQYLKQCFQVSVAPSSAIQTITIDVVD